MRKSDVCPLCEKKKLGYSIVVGEWVMLPTCSRCRETFFGREEAKRLDAKLMRRLVYLAHDLIGWWLHG